MCSRENLKLNDDGKSTLFGLLLLHRLPDLLAEGIDGLFGRQGLEDDDHVGDIVARDHGALLERTDLPDLLDLLQEKVMIERNFFFEFH